MRKYMGNPLYSTSSHFIQFWYACRNAVPDSNVFLDYFCLLFSSILDMHQLEMCINFSSVRDNSQNEAKMKQSIAVFHLMWFNIYYLCYYLFIISVSVVGSLFWLFGLFCSVSACPLDGSTNISGVIKDSQQTALTHSTSLTQTPAHKMSHDEPTV